MSENTTETIARAKVNLCLHVTGRREDGYHLLDGITAFATLGDRVVLERTHGSDDLAVSCLKLPKNAEALPSDHTNLAWRALAAFRAEMHSTMPSAPLSPPIPAGYHLSVEKVLPSGAGLGGGSADAAAVLRLLSGDLGDPISPDRLAALGLTLGADVPVCLLQETRRVSGIGEILQPITSIPPIPAVLIWPGVPLSTPTVFRGRNQGFDRPLTQADLSRFARDPVAALGTLGNGLTEAALHIEPVIGDALSALGAAPGCRLTRMSGSGSAIFGLFDLETEAVSAATALSAAHPDWWVRATEIGTTGA